MICRGLVGEGAHGVMVIIVGNGHSDMSSNPGLGEATSQGEGKL